MTAIVAAAAAGVAAVGVGVWAGASLSGRTPTTALAASSGHTIVFFSTSGPLGVAGVDGSDAVDLASLGSHAVGADRQTQGAAASLDGRYIVSPDGAIIAVAGRNLSLQPSRVEIGPTDVIGGFADSDRDVVVVDEAGNGGPTTAYAEVSVVDWRTGDTRGLGEADSFAGDPRSLGAFVSVAATGESAVGAGDVRVELRLVGEKPSLLATASVLDRALGEPPATPVSLAAFPDASGDEIAVTVDPVGGSGPAPAAGVVVLDRSGRLLDSLRGGPLGGYPVWWSPNGRSVMFFSPLSSGPALTVWNPGAALAPLTRPLPDRDDTPDVCLWSPDGTTVLCETATISSGLSAWVTGSATGGPLVLAVAPGEPVEWLARAPAVARGS